MALRQTLQQAGEFVHKHPYAIGGSTVGILSLIALIAYLRSNARRILRAASKWIGVKEIYNNQGWDNSEFASKMKELGWWSGAEWCNFFVKLVVLSCCKKDSKNFKFWDSHLSPATQTTWSNLQNQSNYCTVSSSPSKGALVIYRNNSDNTKGHIEIVKKVYKDGSYSVISGNSNFEDQTGQGVVTKTRTKNGISGFSILGFITIKKL